MQELEKIRQIQEQINILKKEYDYCKDIVDDIEVASVMASILYYASQEQMNSAYIKHRVRMHEIQQQVFCMRCSLIVLNEQVRTNIAVSTSKANHNGFNRHIKPITELNNYVKHNKDFIEYEG